jgi:hypothetical protein
MKDDISISSNGENTKSDGASSIASIASGTSKGTQDASIVRVVLGQNETRLVWGSKMAVLLVLLVATVSVSMLTYHFTESEEQEDFKTRVSIFGPRTINLYCSSLSNHSFDFAAYALV